MERVSSCLWFLLCCQTTGRADKIEDTDSPRPSQLGPQCPPRPPPPPFRWMVDLSCVWEEGVPQLRCTEHRPGLAAQVTPPARSEAGAGRATLGSASRALASGAHHRPRPAKGMRTPPLLPWRGRHECFKAPPGWHNASTSVPGPQAKATEARPWREARAWHH